MHNPSIDAAARPGARPGWFHRHALLRRAALGPTRAPTSNPPPAVPGPAAAPNERAAVQHADGWDPIAKKLPSPHTPHHAARTAGLGHRLAPVPSSGLQLPHRPASALGMPGARPLPGQGERVQSSWGGGEVMQPRLPPAMQAMHHLALTLWEDEDTARVVRASFFYAPEPAVDDQHFRVHVVSLTDLDGKAFVIPPHQQDAFCSYLLASYAQRNPLGGAVDRSATQLTRPVRSRGRARAWNVGPTAAADLAPA